MTLDDEIKRSREFEMRMYLDSMNAMYENALEQNGEVYDIAFALTTGFENISGDVILADSRVIKTFRYAVSPSISQMKFGQLFGLASIGDLESDKLVAGSSKYRTLKRISADIAFFAKENLDQRRFIWLADKQLKSDLAYEYAKKWTCSLAADQNAQTAYRTWRRTQQELAVVEKLVSLIKTAKSILLQVQLFITYSGRQPSFHYFIIFLV